VQFRRILHYVLSSLVLVILSIQSAGGARPWPEDSTVGGTDLRILLLQQLTAIGQMRPATGTADTVSEHTTYYTILSCRALSCFALSFTFFPVTVNTFDFLLLSHSHSSSPPSIPHRLSFYRHLPISHSHLPLPALTSSPTGGLTLLK
jgi:hypothetical protein